MPLTKGAMTPEARAKFEVSLTKEYLDARSDTKHDLQARLSGVRAKGGASGFQFAGYTKLERFYRGDQWDHDEPPGASQRTDNYCAVIVDNVSSLIFDDEPEINCPTDDPSDDVLEVKAEIKEDLLMKVYEDNDAPVEFDEWAKISSLYGDGPLKGPWMEKVDELGRTVSPDAKGTWKIRFAHIEDPGSVRPLFADGNFKRIIGYIHSVRFAPSRAERVFGATAKARGIKLEPNRQPDIETRIDIDSQASYVYFDEYWTDELVAYFYKDKLVDWYRHDWGFVPLQWVKNIHSPNYPFGKSDIEDVLDPQLSHNRTNNDLANMLKWLSSINMWGKNLEGMQALVAGLSRIYSLPEDGEIHTFEKPGDPYITNTYVQQRRSAIIDVSGISEAMLSSSQLSASSGRALALAFQGTIRKLNPRLKRFCSALQQLNRNIFRLYELYFPETKKVIEGNYRNKVFLHATILRNIVDTINKLQSGIISLDTAQKEAGVKQTRLEQKLMKKDLTDPILGPQIARQPALLPRLQEGQNQPGEQPMGGPGQRFSSPDGAAAANNQQASGAAPTPAPASAVTP